jgi:hypothetical protein
MYTVFPDIIHTPLLLRRGIMVDGMYFPFSVNTVFTANFSYKFLVK